MIMGNNVFMNYSPHFIATGGTEYGIYNKAVNHWTSIHGNKTRADLVSPRSISFHHKRDVEMMK